jgi:S-DNA-T family DNA segregation ATPase FtsK/SpoIIIE
VTRFALQLGEGVKVARVTSLNKDIAYALAAADVRILAPIPGQQAIGIEVPNEDREVVVLGDILSSPEALKARHPMEVGIGRDISGRSVMLNLATMPHLLIAGATGAGKSSCLNSLIMSILMRSTPEHVRMILIDPKRVEMGQYEGVPHLLTAPVTDPKKAANALHWAVREMERRYNLLSTCGFRDIGGYNAAFDRGDLKTPLGVVDEDGESVTYERLPFVLLVVDELADLMMVAARDVEDSICRLAQMARAVGIHLVVATQRPSVNVITGVIKANIPARLAFAVSSLADSRVILDQPGAERLVGNGDMLFLGPSSSVSQRIQGAWVDENEVRRVVESWVAQVRVLEDAAEADEGSHDPTGPVDVIPVGLPADVITEDTYRPVVGGGSDDDELFEQARQLVVSSQLGSTSMLQRKLRVGFARAGRLMDLMEETGVVGPSTGSKARVVLISSEQLEDLQGQGY